MANPLISGLGAFASACLDKDKDNAQALQSGLDAFASTYLDKYKDDAQALQNIAQALQNIGESTAPNLEPLNAVTNIDSPSQTSTAANQPATPPSNQLAFAPAQPIQGTKMPKPAFSTPSPAPSHESTPAPKPKMLNFGDALAQGLPQSWSIVPPTANIVQKPTKPK